MNAYIVSERPEEKLAFYAKRVSRKAALDKVAAWKDDEGYVASHQRRISKIAKAEASKRIRRLSIVGVMDFHHLFLRVERALRPISGIGDLTVYDVALRLGASLGKMPERVYIQRGSRDGARALKLDVRQRSLSMDVFPAELQRLQPWEVEDALCIYEADLRKLKPRRSA